MNKAAAKWALISKANKVRLRAKAKEKMQMMLLEARIEETKRLLQNPYTWQFRV